jgi:hypothetical protein
MRKSPAVVASRCFWRDIRATLSERLANSCRYPTALHLAIATEALLQHEDLEMLRREMTVNAGLISGCYPPRKFLPNIQGYDNVCVLYKMASKSRVARGEATLPSIRVAYQHKRLGFSLTARAVCFALFLGLSADKDGTNRGRKFGVGHGLFL